MRSRTAQEQQSIAFIGSGQITAVIVSFLALKNRQLPEEQKVKISILGKSGSNSLLAMQTRGIKLYTRRNGQQEIIEIQPNEFFVTGNVLAIPTQDHIFVSTKTYSYDETLLESIQVLQKEKSNVIFGQNGIPWWFLPSLAMTNRDVGVAIESGRLHFSQMNNRFAQAIGLENTIGCVLNIACKGVENPDGGYSYFLSTPIENISIPLDRATRSHDNRLLNLQRIFRNAGINTACREGDIFLEVLLKLQINEAINGLSTITGETIGEMMEDAGRRNLIFALAAEVNEAALRLLGKPLRNNERLFFRLESSFPHLTSMATDFNSGKQLEIDSIYHEPIELAECFGVHLNLLKMVAETLIEMVTLRDSSVEIEQVRKNMAETNLSELMEVSSNRYRPSSPTTSPKHLEISSLSLTNSKNIKGPT